MTASTGDKLSPTDLIALAKQAGMIESVNSPIMLLCGLSTLQAFADLIRKDEREACAVECERISPPESFTLDFASGMVIGTQQCAAEIRARTTT